MVIKEEEQIGFSSYQEWFDAQDSIQLSGNDNNQKKSSPDSKPLHPWMPISTESLSEKLNLPIPSGMDVATFVRHINANHTYYVQLFFSTGYENSFHQIRKYLCERCSKHNFACYYQQSHKPASFFKTHQSATTILIYPEGVKELRLEQYGIDNCINDMNLYLADPEVQHKSLVHKIL